MFLNNWGEISTGVDKYIRCLCNFFLQNVITNIIIVGLLLCIKFGDGYHLCQWSTCFRQFIKNVDYVCDEIMFCFSFMAVTFFFLGVLYLWQRLYDMNVPPPTCKL